MIYLWGLFPSHFIVEKTVSKNVLTNRSRSSNKYKAEMGVKCRPWLQNLWSFYGPKCPMPLNTGKSKCKMAKKSQTCLRRMVAILTKVGDVRRRIHFDETMLNLDLKF